jgi:hypothetical protein
MATKRTGYIDTAYRGYLIRKYRFETGYWIEKGGTTVQVFVATEEEAKRIIDTLA